MNIDVWRKNLHRSAGTCDYQQKYKAIIEAEMVSTCEEITNNNPMSPNLYVSAKTYKCKKITLSIFLKF